MSNDGNLPAEFSPYYYKAVVRRVVDGDTIDLDIDLGMNTWIHNERVRLYGIDTPEKYGRNACEAGRLASAYVEAQLPEGKEVFIQTFKDKTGKYGRLLAIIWFVLDEPAGVGQGGIPEVDRTVCNLNEHLVAVGHAKEAKY